jgi:hypothetical protein
MRLLWLRGIAASHPQWVGYKPSNLVTVWLGCGRKDIYIYIYDSRFRTEQFSQYVGNSRTESGNWAQVYEPSAEITVLLPAACIWNLKLMRWKGTDVCQAPRLCIENEWPFIPPAFLLKIGMVHLVDRKKDCDAFNLFSFSRPVISLGPVIFWR